MNIRSIYNSMSASLSIMLKGFCMGIAHLIPGVSGGTIAFIFGIYEQFIDAIKSFDVTFAKYILKFDVKKAFAHVYWKFLATLLTGTLLAIFTLAGFIKWMLINKPVLLHAFFFGLILATIPLIARHVKKWDIVTLSGIGIGSVGMFFVVGLIPVETPNQWWFLFLSGVCSICAMILPGISGAFILVLFGKYQYIIEAVSQRDIATLFFMASGCVVGVLTLVRLLSWLLHKHHNPTIAVLAGLVVGSLRKIWPWKMTLQSIATHSGKIIPTEQINIIPTQFTSEVLFAIVLMIIGFGAAFLMELYGKNKS